MNEEILFSGKMYKKIKKMDRQEMEQYIKSVYRLGFKDGSESGNNADFKIKLVQVLNKTKGIGSKTIDKVLQTLKEEE